MAQALAENAAAIKNMPVKSLGSGKETSFSSPDGSREILDAIRESQDRMAQMIMQHNTMAASNSSNTNANNIQINATPMPPMEDIVKGIVKAQSELFREMSETQTKELSAIISVALKKASSFRRKQLSKPWSGCRKRIKSSLNSKQKCFESCGTTGIYPTGKGQNSAANSDQSGGTGRLSDSRNQSGYRKRRVKRAFSDENNAAEDEEELTEKKKKRRRKK